MTKIKIRKKKSPALPEKYFISLFWHLGSAHWKSGQPNLNKEMSNPTAL